MSATAMTVIGVGAAGEMRVTGTITNSNINNITTGLASGGTGQAVWPGTPDYQPVCIMVTSTAGAQSMASYLFTIWTAGTLAGAGLTQYAVPAGKVLRIKNIQANINSSAVTGGTVTFLVAAATASASLTSAALSTAGRPIVLQMLVSAGVFAGSIVDCVGDVPAGTTVGVQAQGSTAYQIGGVVILGYLF